MTTKPASRRCTATCADGSPCRAWAVRIDDLYARQQTLSRYIDCRADDLAPPHLGRLLRDRQALTATSDNPPSGIPPAVHQALDQLSEEWGIDL
jgi:hypothetical protein